MIIGSHVQMKAPDYLEGSVKEALSMGENAFMLYTGAPQNTRRVPISQMHVQEAKKLMQEHDLSMDRMIIHAPYIINPANSVKPEVGELAVSFLQQEVNRVQEIGAKYIVLHPGSYTTATLEIGIQTAIQHLNEVDVPDGIVILLETMAGKGSEIGTTFEQLAEILSSLKQRDRYGICLDTCHINDAGYDVHRFDDVLDHFDQVIGLEQLHVIHLNDSKNPMNSHKDRHANIGMGTMGFDTLESIATNKRVENVPKILETPYIDGKPPYKEEIEMLKSGTMDTKQED